MADVEGARHRGRWGVDGEDLVAGGRAVEGVDALRLPAGRPDGLQALEAGLLGDAAPGGRVGLGSVRLLRHDRVTVPCVLTLHDTATGRVVPLRPRRPGKIGLYVCGPTVDGVPHLGHGRFSLVFDVLRRYLLFSGLDVTYVSNITDIEDKIIDRAAEQGVPIDEFTAVNEALWWEIMDALGVLRPDETPHATAYVDRMIALIADLVERGVAYETADRRLPVGARRARLRPAGPSAAGVAAGGRPDRGRRGEAVAARLRAVEEGQAGRAQLGGAVGGGPARLAHRVRGHVPRPARRGLRAPRRRPGPDVPPPRERAGPGGGRRQGVRPALDAQRVGDRRRGEDVQVTGQLHVAGRPAGAIGRRGPTGSWSSAPTTGRPSR